ncbi:hypothetical protein KHA80_05580 [Anaerobacillus sp. HL2]|nr:hypothetical protein KHA80_05580 [Anaerobacillus sp. HL2]
MEELIILLKYLLLGIFQVITEPIPISSSGHLVLLQEKIGIDLPGLTFELIVNFASLLAVLIIYRDSISKLFFRSNSVYGKQREERSG